MYKSESFNVHVMLHSVAMCKIVCVCVCVCVIAFFVCVCVCVLGEGSSCRCSRHEFMGMSVCSYICVFACVVYCMYLYSHLKACLRRCYCVSVDWVCSMYNSFMTAN